MTNNKCFDELAKNLFEILPTNLQNLEKDIQKKFKEILQITFASMDLITREEFDVQAKVLQRTREKLTALQTQVNTLLGQKKE